MTEHLEARERVIRTGIGASRPPAGPRERAPSGRRGSGAETNRRGRAELRCRRTLRAAASAEGADPATLTLFYYEAHAEEYDDDTAVWRTIAPDASRTTAVRMPTRKTLCGYDVVTFWTQALPECSPLSWNVAATACGCRRSSKLPRLNANPGMAPILPATKIVPASMFAPQ